MPTRPALLNPALPLRLGNRSSLQSSLQIYTFVFNHFQDAPPATPYVSILCIVARGWVPRSTLNSAPFVLHQTCASKSFRIRTYEQTPRFVGFWPKLSSRNPFRIRTYENCVCKLFRIRTYKKGGEGVPHPAAAAPFAFSRRPPNNEAGKCQRRLRRISSFAFRVSYFGFSVSVFEFRFSCFEFLVRFRVSRFEFRFSRFRHA